MNHQTFSGRRIFITGHTGFKGAWLTQWLLSLGGEITGYSLDPPTKPTLFEQLGLEFEIQSVRGDVRDLSALQRALSQCQPDFVFHLAAQSIVRYSYKEPVETFATNVMGTVNVLEALRNMEDPCVAVMVTTDKCYLNQEWIYGYREHDPLGGSDPYSSSKAMAELAIESYQRSWFSQSPSEIRSIRVASARAGNVIGGGDWAVDRIVPDCVRALLKNEPVLIRNRHARRPWQHVLDPLNGYLMLAQSLATATTAQEFTTRCSPFNFGPPADSNRTVGNLVDDVLKLWPGQSLDRTESNAPHEATLLHLCTEKANTILNWRSLWDFSTSLGKTVEWYRRVRNGESASYVTLEHIRHFEADCNAQSLVSEL